MAKNFIQEGKVLDYTAAADIASGQFVLVGTIGAVPYVMVKAFPPVVRFSGLSFSYNVAYAIFGGLTPMIVSLLLKESPMGPAYYVAILCGIGILVGGYLWKKGR